MEKKTGYDAVVFDMDGVIADSEYFNVKAKHLILKRAGIEVDWHYHDTVLEGACR